MINNRQAGRRRGRGGQRSQGGNPGRGPESGNRIDNRARGNASQLLEKYKTLARDAQMQGDRVNTEYYLQFADHYFRVLAETRSRFDENQNRRPQNDQFDDGDDDDFDGEMMADDRADSYQQDGRGNRDGNRDAPREQSRDQNGNGRDRGNRDVGQRNEGQRNDSQRNDRERGDGYRDNRGQNGSRANGDGDRAPRPAMAEERQPEAVDRAPDQVVEAERPRRGRPRRDAAPAAPRLQDESAPEVIEIDRLPPALSLSATVEGDEPEKPRRRRGRPPASESPLAE